MQEPNLEIEEQGVQDIIAMIVARIVAISMIVLAVALVSTGVVVALV